MNSNKILKGSAIVLAGASFFVGGLLLGDKSSNEAVAYRLPQQLYRANEIPAYPGSMEFPLGDQLAINDVVMRISYFHTKDSVQTVRDFYMNALKKNGLDPIIQESSSGELNVYALTKAADDQINIAISRRGGQTTVFPSIIPLSGKLLNGSTVHRHSDIPMSTNAIGVMNVSSPKEQGSVVSYVEPYFDMMTAIGHIRDTMGRQNWQIEEYKSDMDGSGRAAFIELKKGWRHMLFNLAKNQDDMSGVAIIVNIQESHE